MSQFGALSDVYQFDALRLMQVRCASKIPQFYCIFAGKINSIYEIEKVVSL